MDSIKSLKELKIELELNNDLILNKWDL